MLTRSDVYSAPDLDSAAALRAERRIHRDDGSILAAPTPMAFPGKESELDIIVEKVCEALAQSVRPDAADKIQPDAASSFESDVAAKHTSAGLLRLLTRTTKASARDRAGGASLAFSSTLVTQGRESALATYVHTQRLRQSAFKQSWKRFPRPARADGKYGKKSYPFVLPAGFARENLWDPIRAAALRHFYVQRIAWHDGQNRGPLEQREPSPHLLDSQVCAVNFWWGLSLSPDSLAAALRSVFDDVERVVLPSESGPLAEVEWVGLERYLDEKGWPGRGEFATSADLLLAYEDAAGNRHGVLVESKYTETYSVDRRSDIGRSGERRLATYMPLFHADDSPIRNDRGLDLRNLLVEPFYQHLRQQLLASAMERERELDFATVTCLHVSSRANREFHEGITAPELREPGKTVGDVWKAILVRPDRYRSVAYEDLFAAVAATSDPEMAGWEDYQQARYGWE